MIDFGSQEIFAYAIFGLILNFLFSIAFGLYLSKNIGVEEMILSKGNRIQPWWLSLSLAVPYAKMAITLYRVAILQFYFLDRGLTHKEFWIYLTSND
ncbi:hypothetical protein E0765_06420 [Sulfuricurvum sp. IAE1]|jgi:hypothetical protein|uniref:hypothetical protein n=1 Tax=Sulfuricurvum sp. IAE1 TaxID=2546102 RepID=UPI00104DEBB1|nr:hypothetical protein [Sulfuricurvum sp. IAE1]MDD3769777.1 hypothetical protein [Sulfuricurvum sp.]MDX9966289.1 hypothetical protein [Sulfuricurvum sp.]TDA64346.1 hypothetical protein E0765_06420 [Sulfuricurvum sp. IAE1]